MSPRPLVIDVGANHGLFCLPVAQHNPDVLVLAVEPNSVLAAELRTTAASMGLANLEVLEVAVASQAGTLGTLYVSTEGDSGISSLLPLNREGIQADPYWSQRPDLQYSAEVTVEVVTLESILNDFPEGEVLFLKIDAQGLDIEVLASAGEHHERIMAGMLEVSMTPSARLYSGVDDGIGAAASQLLQFGFAIDKVRPNDPACNEANVYFARSEMPLAEVEKRLSLEQLPIYRGTDFWALSQDQLQSVLVESNARVERLGADHHTEISALQERIETLSREAETLRANLERVEGAMASASSDLAECRSALAASRLALSESRRERDVAVLRAQELWALCRSPFSSSRLDNASGADLPEGGN